MDRAFKYILWIAAGSALALIISIITGHTQVARTLSILTAVGMAIGIRSVDGLKRYQYTAWIIVAIVCGMMYPSAFLKWGNIDLRNKWLILIIVQLVMFGMGTQMSLKDFTQVKTLGRGVVVGLICQFSIMPLVGFSLTKIFNFEPEIAAGIILIGSCSSGLASNVMSYLARANLTLSITLTAIATLLAPVMTPLLMKLLAGTYIEIKFLDMCIQIIKIVIVPIGAALLAEAYSMANPGQKARIRWAFYIASAWLIFLLAGGNQLLLDSFSSNSLRILELIGFFCGALVFGMIYAQLKSRIKGVHEFMPLVSMFGIVYFTTVTTAAARENILAIGILLLLASIMHNTLGYSLGYGLSRIMGLDKNSCRTIALEVGMQNGGMASGLAGVMGKLATLGLAAAIFSPWMNISGSLLANFWRKRTDKL
jgi:BASS family bile acid:Na+ symporter